jgi:hypothetical protein
MEKGKTGFAALLGGLLGAGIMYREPPTDPVQRTEEHPQEQKQQIDERITPPSRQPERRGVEGGGSTVGGEGVSDRLANIPLTVGHIADAEEDLSHTLASNTTWNKELDAYDLSEEQREAIRQEQLGNRIAAYQKALEEMAITRTAEGGIEVSLPSIKYSASWTAGTEDGEWSFTDNEGNIRAVFASDIAEASEDQLQKILATEIRRDIQYTLIQRALTTEPDSIHSSAEIMKAFEALQE